MTPVLPRKGRMMLAPILMSLVLGPAGAEATLSKKKITPAPEKDETVTITRVQIFLDENKFGPGKIDGRLGQIRVVD